MKKLILLVLLTAFCATSTDAMPRFSLIVKKIDRKLEQRKRTRQFKKRKKQNLKRQHKQMGWKVMGIK